MTTEAVHGEFVILTQTGRAEAARAFADSNRSVITNLPPTCPAAIKIPAFVTCTALQRVLKDFQSK